MKPILRPLYLKRIEPMINTEFVKVITGVRRCGKSYLLMMIKDKLEQTGVKSEQILYLNFENPDYLDLLTYRSLYTYLKDKVDKSKKVYFLFDEIQEVKDWQKLINGLRVAYDCDIYITGSNASLLSGELATYLTGRYIEIKMQPLTFNEYLTFKNIQDDPARHFNDYLEYGGFPSVVLQSNDQLKRDVLSGIYNSILLKDVAGRAAVKNTEALERITLYLLSNIGQLISINKISNTLRSANGIKISNNTVENYIHLLEDSFLFYKVPRYDIRGKEYLNGQGKYYVVDSGFLRSQLRRKNTNRGSIQENLVFLELISRGYEVFVGKYSNKEIDFVAQNDDEVLYIQVTDHLPENSTRETDNLLHLPSAYKKIIITNSWSDVGNYDGIQIIHLVDFLSHRK